MKEKEKIEIEKKKIRLTESQNRLQELERLMCVNVNIKMYKSDKIKMYNYSKLT